MDRVLFDVSNLMNSECKTQVKNALDKVKGVQKVGVSLPQGTIAVEYNEPADKKQIKECIEHAGFTIT
jgi:copper chaperone